MDPNTGDIHRFSSDEERQRFERDNRKSLVPVSEPEAELLTTMDQSKRKNWMRNKPCLCGSGKKFKRCCWSKYGKAQSN